MKFKVFKSAMVLMALFACKTQQKAQFVFPPEMGANVRAQYQVDCERGALIYEQNCSGCHTKVVKRKRLIPDFTPEQLSNYEFRFANKSHEDSLTESRLTQDDLVSIITFLTYKTKSGIIVKSIKRDSTDHPH